MDERTCSKSFKDQNFKPRTSIYNTLTWPMCICNPSIRKQRQMDPGSSQPAYPKRVSFRFCERADLKEITLIEI